MVLGVQPTPNPNPNPKPTPTPTPTPTPDPNLGQLQRRLESELPHRYSALPVFSLHHHQRRGLSELRAVGTSFLGRVRQRGAEAHQPALYDRLVRLWGGYGPEAALPLPQKSND